MKVHFMDSCIQTRACVETTSPFFTYGQRVGTRSLAEDREELELASGFLEHLTGHMEMYT